MSSIEEASDHGLVVDLHDEGDRRSFLDRAIDYRGDVALVLEDGSEHWGYLFNRRQSSTEDLLELYPPDGGSSYSLATALVRRIEFRGRDTASGRSWQAWVAKWEAKQAAKAKPHLDSPDPSTS